MASFPSPPVDVPPYYSGNATAQRVYRLPPDETAALNTRVMAAARTGDYEEVRHLLKNVLSVSTRGIGSTPLHIAAEYGHFRIAQELLRVGYDVNVADHMGMTPLRLALEHGHMDCAELFREFGGGVTPQEVTNPVTDDELEALTSSMISGLRSEPDSNNRTSGSTHSAFAVPQSPTSNDLLELNRLEQQLDTVRIANETSQTSNHFGPFGRT